MYFPTGMYSIFHFVFIFRILVQRQSIFTSCAVKWLDFRKNEWLRCTMGSSRGTWTFIISLSDLQIMLKLPASHSVLPESSMRRVNGPQILRLISRAWSRIGDQKKKGGGGGEVNVIWHPPPPNKNILTFNQGCCIWLLFGWRTTTPQKKKKKKKKKKRRQWKAVKTKQNITKQIKNNKTNIRIPLPLSSLHEEGKWTPIWGAGIHRTVWYPTGEKKREGEECNPLTPQKGLHFQLKLNVYDGTSQLTSNTPPPHHNKER